MNFIDETNIFNLNRVYTVIPEIDFSDVESCDEKTAENYQNCYAAEKRLVSKLSKISIVVTWYQIVVTCVTTIWDRYLW